VDVEMDTANTFRGAQEMLNSIDQLAEGGRGIKLLWQIADELSYTRTLDGRNCLLVSKNYKVEGGDRLKQIKQPSVLDRLMNLSSRWDWMHEAEQEEHWNESPVQKISLQINSDLSALSKVLEWFEQLQYLSLANEDWWGCQLALAEGFTNAVRHAHKNLPVETPIQLEVTVFQGYLQFQIWDCGLSFDLNAKLREIIAEDRKYSLGLDSFSDTYFMPSISKSVSESQFLIAG
jgi:serine/threonine-protein kinase RsbW